jgi:hypothetical protein
MEFETSNAAVSGGSSTRSARKEQLYALCERGVDRCRHGEWQEGLSDLAWLVSGSKIRSGMPSAAYSYLGYGMARFNKKVTEGVRLCKHAVKLEFYQTENYINLARACMLHNRHRREAFEAVRDGLKIDPDNPELRELHRILGMRRPPVLSFLGRSNPLNRLLGSLRHAFGGKSAEVPPPPGLDDKSRS